MKQTIKKQRPIPHAMPHEVDTGSTAWVHPAGKMSRAPQARPGSRPEGGRSYFRRLPTALWRRKPLHLTAKLRGGAECWVEIHARGGIIRVPGDCSVYDVLSLIANDGQEV